MTNCTVTIQDVRDTLDAGQRTSAGQVASELYAGPAYLASPRAAWQKAAALEGLLSATLHVHTAIDLRNAKQVELANHIQAGTWHVAQNGVSGAGREWTLALTRRP